MYSALPNPDKPEATKMIASLLKSWPKKQELPGLDPNQLATYYVLVANQ